MRFAGACVFLFLLGDPTAAQTAWTVYRSPDGRFEAAFPAEPRIADVTDGSGRRKFDLIAELADDEAYLVSVTAMPAGTEAGTPVAQVLQKVEEASKRDFAHATIIASGPVMLGPWRGREFAMRNEKGLVYRARLFWIGTTLYQVVAVVGEARGVEGTVRRFLDSFKILKE